VKVDKLRRFVPQELTYAGSSRGFFSIGPKTEKPSRGRWTILQFEREASVSKNRTDRGKETDRYVKEHKPLSFREKLLIAGELVRYDWWEYLIHRYAT